MKNALAVAAFLLAIDGVAWAGPREAGPHVKEALARFEAGDYAAAAEAFARADEALPENPRIALDLAAALAAQGDTNQAAALLEKAAASSDREAAVRARYNLGCLAAEKARTLLGSRPEQAPIEARQQGLDLLARAAGHYRQCLQLDGNHADARHNLEVVRLVMGRLLAASRSQPGKTADPKPGPKGVKPEGAGGKPDRVKPPKVGASDEPRDDEGALPEEPKSADPARQQAEKLISKVRQRSEEKRQWDRKRLPDRWSEREEKDW